MDALEWISVSEAAQLSGFSIQNIRSLIRQGKVKAEKTSGMQEGRINLQSLRDFLWHLNSLAIKKPEPNRNGE